jgi:adenylate cyclase
MKVLVVDDDRSARDFAARVLAEAGYEVSSVDSGDAALARLPEGFEIVVTDLDMPGGLNGVQVTQEVRRSTAADVVIMTAFPDMSTAIHAVRAGAYDYLVKPFSPDTLRLAVDRCAQRRRLSKELERERALKEELSRAYNELSQMQRVRDLFGQFMTPEVVKFVTEHPDDFRTRGDRRVVTVMFVDVRGFTPYAARVSPEEAVGTLNQYFELLVGAVQENGGVVNKFLGDGLMAVFGAPQPNPRHALDAVWAAHKARTLLRFLSRRPICNWGSPSTPAKSWPVAWAPKTGRSTASSDRPSIWPRAWKRPRGPGTFWWAPKRRGLFKTISSLKPCPRPCSPDSRTPSPWDR